MSAALTSWCSAWCEAKPTAPDVIAVRGAGPHLTVLEQRFPAATLLVSAAAEPPDAPGRIRFDPEPARWQGRLRRALAVRLDVRRCNPPDELLSAPLSQAACDELIEIARQDATLDDGTMRTLGALWWDQLTQNLGAIGSSASIVRLGVPWRGLPVLVLGAGPSLTDVLPALREHRSRFAVLAATSALRPLWKHGLVPDAVALIEARSCRHHFDGIPTELLHQTVLLAASHVAPEQLALPWGARALFHGPAGGWLVPWSGRGSLLPTGGNVGTSMLVLAWMLGGFPIAAAGLDCALQDGVYYAGGAGSLAAEHAGQSLQTVTGWRGETLQATAELVSYRRSTELALGEIQRRDGQACFLNVTGRGARVAGMRLAPFEPLVKALPADGAREARGRLLAAAANLAHRPGPLPVERLDAELDRILATIDRWQRDPAGPRQALVRSVGHPPLAEQLLRLALIEADGVELQIGPRSAARVARVRECSTSAARELTSV